MRLRIPLTGTLLTYEPSGDPNDPIRPIDINLGNVSWQLQELDLENDEAIIEVMPADEYDEPTGEVDAEDNPVCLCKPTTPEMKQAALAWVQAIVTDYTKSQLYQISGHKRLQKPFRGKSGEKKCQDTQQEA